MFKKFIWVIALFLLVSYIFALEGGSSNSFETLCSAYELIHNFNASDTGTVPSPCTGETVTDPGSWRIQSGDANHPKGPGGYDLIFDESPTYNHTVDTYMNFSGSFDGDSGPGFAAGDTAGACGSTNVFKWYAVNGVFWITDGDGTSEAWGKCSNISNL